MWSLPMGSCTTIRRLQRHWLGGRRRLVRLTRALRSCCPLLGSGKSPRQAADLHVFVTLICRAGQFYVFVFVQPEKHLCVSKGKGRAVLVPPQWIWEGFAQFAPDAAEVACNALDMLSAARYFDVRPYAKTKAHQCA